MSDMDRTTDEDCAAFVAIVSAAREVERLCVPIFERYDMRTQLAALSNLHAYFLALMPNEECRQGALSIHIRSALAGARARVEQRTYEKSKAH